MSASLLVLVLVVLVAASPVAVLSGPPVLEASPPVLVSTSSRWAGSSPPSWVWSSSSSWEWSRAGSTGGVRAPGSSGVWLSLLPLSSSLLDLDRDLLHAFVSSSFSCRTCSVSASLSATAVSFHALNRAPS